MAENSDPPFMYYDRLDMQTSHYPGLMGVCACMELFMYLDIFMSGFMQGVYIYVMINSKNSRRCAKALTFAQEHPKWFWGITWVPGFIVLACYFVEKALKNETKYYVTRGGILGPDLTAVTTQVTFALSLVVSLAGGAISYVTYKIITADIKRTISTIQKSGVSGYVVYQIIQGGFALPIVALLMTSEILIWLFPGWFTLTWS